MSSSSWPLVQPLSRSPEIPMPANQDARSPAHPYPHRCLREHATDKDKGMGIFFVMLKILPLAVQIVLEVISLIVSTVGFAMSFSYDFFDTQMKPVAFMELVFTLISGFVIVLDAVSKQHRARQHKTGDETGDHFFIYQIAFCNFFVLFSLWMTAVICSILESDFIVPENYLYTPEPSCANYTNTFCSTSYALPNFDGEDDACPEDAGYARDILRVEVGSGIVANCFNSTHACTLKESTGSDSRDELILKNCDQHAMLPCFKGADALCFIVSAVITLMGVCCKCGKVAAGDEGRNRSHDPRPSVQNDLFRATQHV